MTHGQTNINYMLIDSRAVVYITYKLQCFVKSDKFTTVADMLTAIGTLSSSCD
jgi:hypothetical protein